MKTIKFYAVIAVLAFALTSCVENSGKYKAAVAQRDSLTMLTKTLDSNYNESLVLLNDIEAGFATINQNEKDMKELEEYLKLKEKFEGKNKFEK